MLGVVGRWSRICTALLRLAWYFLHQYCNAIITWLYTSYKRDIVRSPAAFCGVAAHAISRQRMIRKCWLEIAESLECGKANETERPALTPHLHLLRQLLLDAC